MPANPPQDPVEAWLRNNGFVPQWGTLTLWYREDMPLLTLDQAAFFYTSELEARKDELEKRELVKYDDGYTTTRFRRQEGLWITQDERLAELDRMIAERKKHG